MKKSVSLYAAIIAFVCIAVSCSSNLLDSIQDDIAEQKKKEALEKQEGKTPEMRKPVITIFAWQGITGGTTNNPTVLFSCSAEAKAVSATGSAVISGYYISFNSTTPTLDAEGWLSDKPESITFPSINGEHTAYLWVKDSFGNMSDAAPLSNTLALKPLLWNAVYLEGMSVPAHEEFNLTADEPLDAAGASVSGAGTGTVALSGTGNQTITVSPSSLWTTGTHTITVTAKTALGLTASASRTFTVFNGVCVSVTGSGSVGSARQPVGTIAVGITRTQTLYPGGGEVHISQGEYTTNWADSVNRIILVDGVSLVGGYKPDWTSRDVAGYQTVIRDQSSSGGNDSPNSNRAVNVPATVTNVTRIDGLKVIGGAGAFSASIYSMGSPRIQNCTIIAGTGTAERAGLLIAGGNIEVVSCDINIGSGGNTSVGITYGINSLGLGSPEIRDSRISGGRSADQSYGISGNVYLLERNIIDGGNSVINCCVSAHLGSSAEIRNNILHTGDTVTNGTIYGLYAQTLNNIKIRNNTFILKCTPSATNVDGYGVYCKNNPGPTIENNLFISPSVVCTKLVAIYKSNVTTTPPQIRNNGYSGFTHATSTLLYESEAGVTYNQSQIANLNAESFASANAVGNANTDSTHRLTSLSPSEFTTGGLDGSTNGWLYSDDCSGQPRTGNGTTGWSMGCYEY